MLLLLGNRLNSSRNFQLVWFAGDMYKGDEGEEEPEWVKNEREQFSSYRDKDGDGFLNADEVPDMYNV